MIDLVINLSIGIFAMCALSIILNNSIKKSILSWVFLIGIVLSALAMLVNQQFYNVAFASFAFFAAAIAIYMTRAIHRLGEI